MRRKRYDAAAAQAAVLEGVNGDILAAYVAEGLVPSTFIPTGEDKYEVRSSIEAKAMSTWMKTEGAKDGTLLMGAEETRLCFHRRNHFGSRLPLFDEGGSENQKPLERFRSAFSEHQAEESERRSRRQKIDEYRDRARSGFTPASALIPAELTEHGDSYEGPDEDVPPPVEE